MVWDCCPTECLQNRAQKAGAVRLRELWMVTPTVSGDLGE